MLFLAIQVIFYVSFHVSGLIFTCLEELKAQVKSLKKSSRHHGSVPAAAVPELRMDNLNVDTFPLETLQEIHDFEGNLADEAFQQKVVSGLK